MKTLHRGLQDIVYGGLYELVTDSVAKISANENNQLIKNNVEICKKNGRVQFSWNMAATGIMRI